MLASTFLVPNAIWQILSAFSATSACLELTCSWTVSEEKRTVCSTFYLVWVPDFITLHLLQSVKPVTTRKNEPHKPMTGWGWRQNKTWPKSKTKSHRALATKATMQSGKCVISTPAQPASHFCSKTSLLYITFILTRMASSRQHCRFTKEEES